MDKREQILESALKLFVERGFHATPTSAITKEAGMSSGILFHYFPTKDDLIVNLYIELKKDFFEAAFLNMNKISTEEGKLRLLWSNAWNWGLDNPLKFKFLLQADNSIYQETAINNQDVNVCYENTFSFIKEGIDKNIVRNIQPEFVMIISFAMISSMVQYLSKYPEFRNDNSFIEQAWEMYVNSLRK